MTRGDSPRRSFLPGRSAVANIEAVRGGLPAVSALLSPRVYSLQIVGRMASSGGNPFPRGRGAAPRGMVCEPRGR